MVEGVTATLKIFDEVIVLEEDLEVFPFFVMFMLDGLDTYRSDTRVASIHGHSNAGLKTEAANYFLRGADCWGWATRRRAWSLYERDSGELAMSG